MSGAGTASLPRVPRDEKSLGGVWGSAPRLGGVWDSVPRLGGVGGSAPTLVADYFVVCFFEGEYSSGNGVELVGGERLCAV